MNKKIISILFASILAAHATTYYVATNGLNTNPGTSGQPWHTINYAVSSLSGVGAGDTILVRAGNYPEAVEPDISGTADAPIVLRNRPNEVVTLNPGRFYFGDGINYWHIRGFCCLRSDKAGLRLEGKHVLGCVIVDSCIFSHHEWDGVFLGGSDFGGITINDCILEWNGEVNGVPTGEEGHGIVMYADTGIVWLHRNLIANNWAKGISHGHSNPAHIGDSSVVDSNIIFNNVESGLDWHADNSYIEHNGISYNGVRDPESGEWGDKGLHLADAAENNLVAFNVIKSSGGPELVPLGARNKCYNNTFIKDVFYDTVPGTPGSQVIIFYAAAGDSNEFRNNIIINLLSEDNNHYIIIAENVGRYTAQIWSNNLYWTPNASNPPPANKSFKLYGFPGSIFATLEEIQATYPDQEIGSIYDNPDFVSYADSNFNLLPGSPAIDAGTYVGFPYYGDAPDMGAFEYNPAGITSFEESPNNGLSMQVYPNPFSTMTVIEYALSSKHYAENNDVPTAYSLLPTVCIYDISGRLVRSFPLPSAYSILPTSLSWNGTDDFGKQLPAGVYFMRLKVDEFSITEKTIKLR